MVKEVAKLIMKAEIYPTKEASRAATEIYLEHNHQISLISFQNPDGLGSTIQTFTPK